MPLFPIPNYPQPFGSRKINVMQYQGPSAYVQGGESFNATQMGFGSFDAVIAGDSFNANNSGNYACHPRYPVAQAGNNVTGGQTINLTFVAQNGTEAANNTNFSAEYVRVTFIGG